jgi:hypothetical protein
MADEVLVAPIVRPTSTGLRCNRATVYAEIPEVDGNGTVTGTLNLEINLGDPNVTGLARTTTADFVRALARYRGVIS